MNITSFTVAQPDDTGDMNAEINFSVVNTTDKDVRHIRFGAVFENQDGIIIAGECNNTDDCMIEAGEESSYNISGWLKDVYTNGERNGIKAKVFSRMFEREFYKLGDVAVPKENNTFTTFSKDINSPTINDKIVISILRTKPDEDGNITVTAKCSIENKTSDTLYNVTFKVKLIDKEGSEIDYSEANEDIPPSLNWYLETGIWGIKKSKLKDAELSFQLSIYKPILTQKCEGLSSPADE